jgi:hypothetical protein
MCSARMPASRLPMIAVRRPMLAEYIRPIYIERGILVDMTTGEER